MFSRALSVAAGALDLALSIMIMAPPLLFGIALAAFVIGIAVLVYSMRLVVTGIYERKGRDYEIYNVSTKSYITA